MSDEEALAQAVATRMKEEDEAMDPRLERYARGELSEAERFALLRESADDPELAAQVELFAPLSSSLLDRVRPRPSRRRRARASVAVGAVALAAAASVALLLGLDPKAALPTYSFEVRAGDARFRSDEKALAAGDDVRVVRSDSMVELRLIPAEPVERAVEARLFVKVGETLFPSPIAPEISKEGSVRFRARAGALAGVDRGRVTLVAVVGRSGPLGGDLDPSREGAHTETLELLIQPSGGF